jgi:hypothetical protein
VPENILMPSNNPCPVKNACLLVFIVHLNSKSHQQSRNIPPPNDEHNIYYSQQLLQAILLPGVVRGDVPLLYIKIESSVAHLFVAFW